MAASLPGGDPLAAALAAGETPSPELVAASGEEGTLSRRRAWGLGAACLASLAIAAGTWQMTSLAGIVPFEGSPDVLRAKARNILRDLGHDETARDHAWEITVDDQRLGYLTDAPGEAIGFAKVARAVPTPLAFHYRQSPSALRPVSVAGIVTADDPAPLVPGEAAVYLVISTRLGAALFDGVVVWLFYLGLEPFARRSWPHLLIGWTRFLDGRWRDPLVGQAVLAGVLFGTILPAVATLPEASGRLLGLAGAQPSSWAASLGPPAIYLSAVGNMALAGLKNALALVAFMVVARFALRTPGAVLAATALVAATAATSGVAPMALDLAQATICGVATVVLFRRFGLLALTIGLAVNYVVRQTPWTINLSKWFVWRPGLTCALVIGLVVWGFINVLGRQPVVAAPDLDA